MKKAIFTIALGLVLMSMVAGCAFAAANVTPITREEGSGTRGAFVELFDVREEIDGKKIDAVVETAETTNSTSVMITSVAGDPSAIGYISLGSLNDTVKALQIEGVAPSVETVKDGTYPISRPFNILLLAGNEGKNEAAQDFIGFILSAEGQAIVENGGYIKIDEAAAYEPKEVSGKVVIAGSSSVTPIMEKLAEAYAAINASVEIEIQESDSTTGVNSTIEGICDIGMASRELKDSEIEKGLSATQIAIDGLAVIVNNDNVIETLTKEQVRSIFLGETTDWDSLK